MKRIDTFWRALVVLGVWQINGVEPIWGQTGLFNTVVVRPTVSGGTFHVNGVPYTSAQAFRWQVGDTHTIRIYSPQLRANPYDPNNQGLPGQVASDAGLGARYIFSGQYEFNEPPPANGVTSEAQEFVSGTTDPLLGELVLRIRVWPNLRSIDLTVVKQYQMRFLTRSNGCAPLMDPLSNPLPGACGPTPGFIDVSEPNGSCGFRAVTGNYWCNEGARVRLLAVPSVGYAFESWNTQPGIGQQINGLGYGYAEFTLNTPFHMQAMFGPGKFYQLRTDPAGLEVVVDRNLIRTRNPDAMVQSLCDQYRSISIDPNQAPALVGQGGDNSANGYCTVWGFNTTRILAAPESQRDAFGKVWAFDSITNTGLGQNSEFHVSGANLSTNTITWKFVPTASVSFLTQPQLGLPLVVNNRTWPSYFFNFGLNKDFSFAAPMEAVDSNGQRWRFRGWSNGGAIAQTIRVSQDLVNNGLTLIALYEPMNKLSVTTNPPGLSVMINGEACASPCFLERVATESVTVAVMPSVTQANVLKLDFEGWADGGEATRTVNFNVAERRLVANYRQSYLVTALSNPTNGASFQFNPTSPDGFYPLDSQVSISATTREGFRFLNWEGDFAGRFPTASLRVGGPRSVVANLETVPFLDPAGIKNAAGTGPQDQGEIGKVAPGSLISIVGVNLTTKEETGPASPQAQALGDLVVRVGGRFLPLSSVSSTTINAQLPFELPLGRNRLTVTRVGQPELSAEFEAVRNAPGLFGMPGSEAEGLPPLAMMLKADGSRVSDTNPVRSNELVSLLATGVGPYRANPPIGFAIPPGAAFSVADSVEILAGDAVVQPTQAIATPGFVGMTSIQFRVGAQFPVGQSTQVRIRVNGKESNAVRVEVR